MRIAILISLSLCVVFSGCASKKSSCCAAKMDSANSVHEVTVQKPYDYVYLGVFNVVNSLNNWVPIKTLKGDGLIRIGNTDYSKFDDSDKRSIDIRIRRDAQSQTTVYLAPESVHVIGANEVLDSIRDNFDLA